LFYSAPIDIYSVKEKESKPPGKKEVEASAGAERPEGGLRADPAYFFKSSNPGKKKRSFGPMASLNMDTRLQS
jgi:hypothetical protein